MTGIILAVAIFIAIGAIDSAIHVNDKAIERMNAYGSSSSNSKITVKYVGVDTYFGNGNVLIKNLHSKKTIVSEKLNFEKQHNSQGKNCCVKTYDFKKKGNYNGDQLLVRVTANGGSWSEYETLHLGSMSVRVSMDEVNCRDDC